MLFHWFVDRPLASPWPRGLSSKPWWSLAFRSLRYVPSENARSSAAKVLG